MISELEASRKAADVDGVARRLAAKDDHREREHRLAQSLTPARDARDAAQVAYDAATAAYLADRTDETLAALVAPAGELVALERIVADLTAAHAAEHGWSH